MTSWLWSRSDSACTPAAKAWPPCPGPAMVWEDPHPLIPKKTRIQCTMAIHKLTISSWLRFATQEGSEGSCQTRCDPLPPTPGEGDRVLLPTCCVVVVTCVISLNACSMGLSGGLRTHAHTSLCSFQHYSQLPRHENNVSVHWQMNE